MKNFTVLEQPFLYTSRPYNFDLDRLKSESVELLSKYGSNGQVSLKHRKDTNEESRWQDGTGSAIGDGQFLNTKEYIVFNKELKGSYLEIVHDIMANNFNFGRMRLMKLSGRQCMSLHVDLERRIHIPIITNENCLMIVDDEVIHMPADGNAYLVDTKKRHTALNSNKDFDRIHLMFDLL
jgi:hypothetical protein